MEASPVPLPGAGQAPAEPPASATPTDDCPTYAAERFFLRKPAPVPLKGLLTVTALLDVLTIAEEGADSESDDEGPKSGDDQRKLGTKTANVLAKSTTTLTASIFSINHHRPRRSSFDCFTHLLPASGWPPFDAQQPFVDSPTGLRISFPIFEHGRDPGTVADLPREHKLQLLEELQRSNAEEQGNQNYEIDPNHDDVPLDLMLELLSLLPLELVQEPPAGKMAFQPLSGTRLNVEIAKYKRKSLKHYFYYIAVFVKDRSSAEAFRTFAGSNEMLDFAGTNGQRSKYEAWLAGLDRFDKAGGWAGIWKSLSRYVGEADGWDVENGPDDKVSLRAFAHFVGLEQRSNPSLHKTILRVLSLFRDRNPDLDMRTSLAFVCTAENVPPSIGSRLTSERDIKKLEALISALTFSGADWGGANVSSCGRIDHCADMLSVASKFPPAMPVSALKSLTEVPASIYLGLSSHFQPSTPLSNVVSALASGFSARQARAAAAKEIGAAAPARKSRLRDRLFAASSGGHGLRIALPEATKADLQDRYGGLDVAPNGPLKSSNLSELSPYRQSSFYAALWSLQSAAKKPLPTIITADNIRTGVQLELQKPGSEDGRDRRTARVRAVLAHGKSAVTTVLRFHTDEAAGLFSLEFDAESRLLYFFRDDEILTMHETPGLGSNEVVGVLTPAQIRDRSYAERASGATAAERTTATEARQNLIDKLWKQILAP
ncbi:uncharacterized protein JCM10292_004206 [Rhodotorula paludigena]|uniref:uncharacterized protein n=1 Tax=Rhodotorula paludigena TaxID=86838 RepID=UPI00317A2CFB